MTNNFPLMFCRRFIFSLICMLVVCPDVMSQASEGNYLAAVKDQMKKKWPDNRTINLVFHGHSVPAGYFKTPEVRTLDAYPNQVLRALKVLYPTAVINVIVTAIGGENSVQGEKRFEKEVLVHRPDVLFIDYALNDRRVGLPTAREATERMIRRAKADSIPVILLTPSPDVQVDLLKENNILESFSVQIRAMAKEHGIGLVDSYAAFHAIVRNSEDLQSYMSQSNHPNEKGHALIARKIMQFFK